MKLIIDIAFGYLRTYLLPIFANLPSFGDFLALLFDFAIKAVGVYTDGDPNNKAQLLALLESNCVVLASTFTASMIRLIRNVGIRSKLAAIFADAARQLQPAEIGSGAPTAAS